MSIITDTSREWFRRPAEERYLSLDDLHADLVYVRDRSVDKHAIASKLRVEADGNQLYANYNGKVRMSLNNLSTTQLATITTASPSEVARYPADIAARMLNYRLDNMASVEAAEAPPADEFGFGEVATRNMSDRPDMSLLIMKRDTPDNEDASYVLRSVNGPNYGRVYNADIVAGLMRFAGDGVSGKWRVPYEFGKEVAVTKQNTTIYGSDRDIHVALANEVDKIDVPGRGLMSRAVIATNSEVGCGSMTWKAFYMDYACMNRIFWGVHGVMEFKAKHTRNAANRFKEQFLPQLEGFIMGNYRDEQGELIEAIAAAKSIKVDEDRANRLIAAMPFGGSGVIGTRRTPHVWDAHMRTEGRPIETLWDVHNGLTAYSQKLPYASDRNALDIEAGKLLTVAVREAGKVKVTVPMLPAPDKSSKAKRAAA